MKLLATVVLLDLDHPEANQLPILLCALPHELPAEFRDRVRNQLRRQNLIVTSRRSGTAYGEEIWEVRRLKPNHLAAIIRGKPQTQGQRPTGILKIVFDYLAAPLPTLPSFLHRRPGESEGDFKKRAHKLLRQAGWEAKLETPISRSPESYWLIGRISVAK